MVVGHAHPAIVRAVSERVRLGSHFSAPTEDATFVAEDLAKRFALPKWRFTNSGTEATMDAIRIARGVTGRDTIVKILGSYHGHHDAVMVAVGFDLASDADPDTIPSNPYGEGLPQTVADLTVAVPFNDAEALSRRLDRLEEEGRLPACMIMEAAMMNLGVVPRARLPRGRPRGDDQAGDPADLRRGQDRAHDRPGRRNRALRHPARPRHAGEDAGRRLPDRRRRWDRGGDGGGRVGTREPGRHVQRQPREHGRGPRDARRGPDRRRIRAAGGDRRQTRRRLSGGDRPARPPRVRGRDRVEGLRHLRIGADHRLPHVQAQPGRGAVRASPGCTTRTATSS